MGFRPLSKIVENRRCQCFSIARSYERRFPPVGRRKKVGRIVFVSLCVCVCVCVCPSISGNSARSAGPIGTGVAPMDAPKRRNDNGAGRGSAGGTWLVARAAA